MLNSKTWAAHYYIQFRHLDTGVQSKSWMGVKQPNVPGDAGPAINVKESRLDIDIIEFFLTSNRQPTQ